VKLKSGRAAGGDDTATGQLSGIVRGGNAHRLYIGARGIGVFITATRVAKPWA